MSQRKFIFHIRAHNDCDHFVPIIWQLLNKGHNIVIIPMYGFQAHQDYRIKFLTTNFKNLLEVIGANLSSNCTTKFPWLV